LPPLCKSKPARGETSQMSAELLSCLMALSG
jgi:hypothetical protein